MVKRRSGRAAVLIIGKLSMTLAQGLILVVLARLEGAAVVGLYTLGLAIVSPIFLMSHMRMQDVIATHPDNASVWAAHARLLLLTGMAAFTVAGAISIIWPTRGLWEIVIPLSLTKAVESVVFTCHGYWQSQGRVFRIAASNAVRAFAALATITLGTWLSGVVLGVALMAGVATAQLLLWELRQVPSLRSPGTRGELWRLLGTVAPLGLVAMLLSLNQNVVRMIVEFHVGTAELGIFAASAYLVRTGAIAAQAIGQEGAPRIRAARASGDAHGLYVAGLRSAGLALAIGVILLLLGVWVGPDVVALLYGDHFRPSQLLLAMILLAGVPLFGSTALSVTTVASGRHRAYVGVVSASLVATALAALILTPAWGLIGAAGAWAFGETLKFVLIVWLLRGSAKQATSSSLGEEPERLVTEVETTLDAWQKE